MNGCSPCRAAKHEKAGYTMKRGLTDETENRERRNAVALDDACARTRLWFVCACFIGTACGSSGTGDPGQSTATGATGTQTQAGGSTSTAGGMNSSGDTTGR